jgi:hypothetical protein
VSADDTSCAETESVLKFMGKKIKEKFNIKKTGGIKGAFGNSVNLL